MLNARNPYQELARRNARDALITSHLPLVRHIIGRLAIHFPAGIDKENLEAAGALGLVEAAQSYDVTQNVQFKTFAYVRIRGAILDELRRNSPLPQHMQEKVARVRRALETLSAPVTMDQLSAATGLSNDEVSDVLAAMRFVRLVDEDARLEGRPDPHAQLPDAPLARQEEHELLLKAIASLPSPQRTVVTLYYHEDLRLKEISEVMQLSESRVSRLLSAALLTLRERMRVEERLE
jgi:RNA polymerase sigma factor for flagellar operon FliA